MLIDKSKKYTNEVDIEWVKEYQKKHKTRVTKYVDFLAKAPVGSDGLMHPNRIISALNKHLPKKNIIIADGGDFLSFVRIGINADKYLDPGALGCLGVGTPFGVGAYLACKDHFVGVLTGDGSFGFSAMELDTVVRHQIPILIIVANNGSWAIEVRDQIENYGKSVGTTLQFSNYAELASSFGMFSIQVKNENELEGSVVSAINKLPALLDVTVTPEAISPDAKSGLAWVPIFNLSRLGIRKKKMERDWLITITKSNNLSD